MSHPSFADLPAFVKITSILAPFLAWVMFAEFIIDRHGFDKFLPFYRVGNLCAYDGLVVVALAISWFFLHRR